jgi:hypothetical protein
VIERAEERRVRVEEGGESKRRRGELEEAGEGSKRRGGEGRGQTRKYPRFQ